MTNPIWKALLSLLMQGKDVDRVTPNPQTTFPRKSVLFHFADQTEYELPVPGDRDAFAAWWTDASTRFHARFTDEDSNGKV